MDFGDLDHILLKTKTNKKILPTRHQLLQYSDKTRDLPGGCPILGCRVGWECGFPTHHLPIGNKKKINSVLLKRTSKVSHLS